MAYFAPPTGPKIFGLRTKCFELYLSGAVGLEGAEHGDGLQEQLPDADAAQVFVPLVQRQLDPVLQALREPRQEVK